MIRNLLFPSNKINYPLTFLSLALLSCLSAKGFNSIENVPLKIANVKESLNLTAYYSQTDDDVFTVVIDAGHGGKDHGCAGPKSREKFLALNIAKILGNKIIEYHPEVEVIYTREHDVFIPLNKRIDIANKNKADLFISIHCNFINHYNTSGTETYVMGLHRAEENLEVAKRENSSILYEKDFKHNYDGYDPNSPEAHIILSLFQNAYIDQSIKFATLVEQSFNRRTPLKSRGVKQAGFVVLRKATMPSVLVETGFLSSKKDESYLRSEKGQDEIAQALVLAFTEYLREIELSLETMAGDAYVSLEENSPTDQSMNDHKNPAQNKPMIHSGSSAVKSNFDVSNNNPEETRYKIQIAASVNKPIPQNNPLLSQIIDLEVKMEENLYKYLTGNFYSLEKAISERTKMRAIGFKGAFIVAYQGDKRVKL